MHVGMILSYHLPASSYLKFRDYVNQLCNLYVNLLEKIVTYFQEKNWPWTKKMSMVS